MSKKRKGTPPVTFRSGDLLPELTARDGHAGKSTGTVASRDLRRLYALYADALARLTLTPDEGRLLTDIDEAAVTDHRRLWANVTDAIRDEGLAQLHNIPDPSAFIDRLRDLGPVESLALLDALERFRIAYKQAGGGAERVMRDILPVRDG